MRSRIAELEMQLMTIAAPPTNINELEHGSDLYIMPYELKIDDKGTKKEIELEATWDEIFSYCGAALVGECTDAELSNKIQLLYWHAVPDEIVKYNSFNDIVVRHID